jgi:ubiquinone/menaquinone biosynthesis C-methylase UbiE
MNKIYRGTRKLQINSDRFIINNFMNNSKLLKLFIKILKNGNINQESIINIFKQSLKQRWDDETIINKFRSMIKNPINTYNENYNMKRAEFKWSFIKKHINIININSIMDFGGNVGDTAYYIGKQLGLSKENINVVDINEWAGLKWEPRKDITFTHYNQLSKIKDKSIDLITIFHSLHHIKESDFEYIMNNLNRILSDKGIIVLYEHNNNNYNISKLIDLEHCLYDVVLSQKLTYKQFLDPKYFYAKYLSINQWERIFYKYFKKYYYYEMHNLDNSFFMFFRKNNY